MKIVDIALKRPVTVLILTLSLIGIGLYSMAKMGVERIPNIEFPIVLVRTTLEGASPAIIDNDVTDVLEARINTIEGIKNINSSSYEGMSLIVVEFELDRNIDFAAADVRGKANMAQGSLPDDADPPMIDKYDPGDMPIMTIAVITDDTVDSKTLTNYVDKILTERLQTVQGVGNTSTTGFLNRQIRVWVDTSKLESRNLTVADIKAAIRSKHVELPAGRVETGEKEYGIRLAGEFSSIEELEDLPLTVINGTVVRLKDVATIEDGLEDRRTVAKFNGENTILVQVRKQRGGNEVAMSEAVTKRVAELNQIAPPGIRLEIIRDSSIFIRASMNGVKNDTIMGIILTSIIMFLFLRTIRSTFVAVITIPVCLLGSMIALYGVGITINNMSMMGISLSVGMVVDATTVVMENIQRHREMGKTAYRASLDGTKEVGFSVLAGSATTIAVFLPLALMPGMIGRFFRPFGLTVTLTIVISLMLSLTLTPFLCSRILGRFRVTKLQQVLEAPFIWLERLYSKVLGSAVRHRLTTVAIALGIFVFGLFIATKLGTEFAPSEDQGRIRLEFELPADTALEVTENFMEEINGLVSSNKYVDYTYATIAGGFSGEVYKGTINMQLTDRTKRPKASAIMRELRAATGIYKDVDIKLGSWGGSDISLVLQGPTSEGLAEIGELIKADLAATNQGLVDITTDLQMNKPRLNLGLNRALADDLDVSIRSLTEEIQAWFGGTKAGTFSEGGYRYDIQIRAEESRRDDPLKVSNTIIRTPSGELIRAEGLIEPMLENSPNVIKRFNRQRSLSINANVVGISPGEGIAIMEEVFRKYAPADGSVTMTPTGDSENMRESFASLMTALIFAIILVYIVMAIQFESFLHPLTVMFSLPLMTAGSFGFLYLMGLRFSVMVFMGLILLVGVVVNNAILLVDFTNSIRAQGKNKVEAILEAGPNRLRAILMTSVSTIVGTMPIALGFSEGGEVRQPMSVTTIGGLFTSTLLTLIVIPVMYLILDDLKDWVMGKIQRYRAWRRLKQMGSSV